VVLGGAGMGDPMAPPVLVGVPLRSGAGRLLSGGGDVVPGMMGAVPVGGAPVVPGAGATGGPVMMAPGGGLLRFGGATGPPATPGAGGLGSQTPPYAPAALAGGFIGQK
jgi:hypothetical protein